MFFNEIRVKNRPFSCFFLKGTNLEVTDEKFASGLVFYYIASLLPTEVDTGTSHNPQTWLLHGSEVVVAMASDIVGLHVDAIFLLIPHQLAVYLGVGRVAVHALLPAHRP